MSPVNKNKFRSDAPAPAPQQTAVKTVSPDGATVVKEMILTGLVKTTKGYAVATVVLRPTGEVVSCALGHSQAYKEFVALEHSRLVLKLAQAV